MILHIANGLIKESEGEGLTFTKSLHKLEF